MERCHGQCSPLLVLLGVVGLQTRCSFQGVRLIIFINRNVNKKTLLQDGAYSNHNSHLRRLCLSFMISCEVERYAFVFPTAMSQYYIPGKITSVELLSHQASADHSQIFTGLLKQMKSHFFFQLNPWFSPSYLSLVLLYFYMKQHGSHLLLFTMDL